MKGVTDRCDSHVSVIVRYSHRHHKKAVIDAGDTYTCVQIGKPGRAASRDYFVKLSPPELIFVTNITNYICGEKIVMWRNFGKCWEFFENFF